MAQDEIFAGPMSETVPTSSSSFMHRRARADSSASFTYYGVEDYTPPPEDDTAVLDDELEIAYDERESTDLEAGELSTMHRVSTSDSRTSVQDRLLRSDSMKSEASGHGRSHRTSQKIYIAAEDLTIVVAGFRTSRLGFALYITICVLTFGLGYLLLRWLPRWRVKLFGVQVPLNTCQWVVIEVSKVQSLRLNQHLHSMPLQCPIMSVDSNFGRTNGENLSFRA